METSCLDYCTSNCELKLPDSLTTMEDWCLSSNHFPKITIGSKLKSITDTSLVGIITLGEIILSEDNPYFSIDEQFALYNKDKTRLIIAASNAVEKFVVPVTVTSINSYAFAWTRFKEVEIPESLEIFPNNCFINMTRLRNFIIRGNIVKLPTIFFRDVDQLQNFFYKGSLPVKKLIFNNLNVSVKVCYQYKGTLFAQQTVEVSMDCLAYPYFKCTIFHCTTPSRISSMLSLLILSK